MSELRRLAAIIFTNIVGSTSLMSSNEQKTLALVIENQKIHRKWIRQFGGNRLKEIGDGMLASFPSVSNAVLCAAAILREASSEIKSKINYSSPFTIYYVKKIYTGSIDLKVESKNQIYLRNDGAVDFYLKIGKT